MAPSHQLQFNSQYPDQTHSKPKKNSRLGSSKAQLCLQKILHIILTIPEESKNGSTPVILQNDDVPLPVATKTEDPPPETQSPAGEVDDGEVLIQQEKVVQVVKEAAVDDDDDDDDDVDDKSKGGDCMGLLIEAAKLIFGEIKEEEKQREDDFKDEEETATETASDLTPGVKAKRKNNERWTVDLYGDMEPVIRSKRGRTQVLPCKYRDSVIEPLTRVSRSRTSLIHNKRRLR